jgi:ferredoxin-NADP reductase
MVGSDHCWPAEARTEVKLEGPFGDLKLHTDVKRTAVFLAGGIGITPFHSILLDAARRKLPHRIFLFYSNRRPEDAAFLDELQALEKQDANYTFVGTMTEMEKSKHSWQGERGLINKEMLAKYLKGAASPIYYIAGPPAMVTGLHPKCSKKPESTMTISVKKSSLIFLPPV